MVIAIFGFTYDVWGTRAINQDEEIVVKFKDVDEVVKFKFIDRDVAQEALYMYKKHPGVEIAESNSQFSIVVEPIDYNYKYQNHLRQIKAPLAWNKTKESPEVVIAILDTGVDTDHPDLKNNIWRNINEIPDNGVDDDGNGYIDDIKGWDFITDSADPEPKFEEGYTDVAMHHGTLVAGVAAAEGGNTQGVTGVTWRAKIMPLRVLSGVGQGDTIAVSNAISYAIKNGADIINMSFVGENASETLAVAIEEAYRAGVLVVAAAGNDVGDGVDMGESPRYPVCHDGKRGENYVIGVTSVDSLDRKTNFGNYGKCVDISAPGTGIYTTVFNSFLQSGFDRYYGGGWVGTSVSAPQVSGAAALVKSLRPNMSVNKLREIILDGVDNIDSVNPDYRTQLGFGRLNLNKVIIATLGNDVSSQPNIKDQPVGVVDSMDRDFNYIAVGAQVGGGPHVRVYRQDGQLVGQFFAAVPSFLGGVNVSLIDIDDDTIPEVVAVPVSEDKSWVRIFNLKGEQLNEFLAYEKEFLGGVEVATGDVDGDGNQEIIVAPRGFGKPQIRVYDKNGKLKKFFFTYHESYRGGLRLAVGDINEDKLDEIVVAPANNLSPVVKIMNGSGDVLDSYFAFESGFVYGFNIGVYNRKIVVSSNGGTKPIVRVLESNGKLIKEWLAYDERFRGAVHISVTDLDGDGQVDIITTPGKGGGPHLRIFDIQGKVKGQWMAYNSAFRGGVSVATLR